VLDLTPVQFRALFEAHFEQKKFLDIQLGYIRSIFANQIRDSASHPLPFTTEEFVMLEESREDIEKLKEQSPDQQLSYVENFVVPILNVRAAMIEAEAEGKEDSDGR
jgi:hypothetical protein